MENTDIWYYKILNLPTMPSNLEEIALRYENSKIQYKVPPKTSETDTFYLGDKYYKGAIYSRYLPTPEILDWFFQTILPYKENKETQVLPGIQVLDNGNAFHFHTDGKARPFVLNYMIDLGGENVQTIFGQEPNQSIIRSPFLNKFHCEDYTVLESVILPTNNWVILNSMVLHAVIDMQSPRMCLSMGITEEEMSYLETNSINLPAKS